ncbi:carboxymuconolactone decarboxylase family protein [Mycobacterium sp. 4D054]|uniref:carboxymuconolactone decarboxylase family protein n=1 Tax=unclassified Mycobacterium TaxID=2642494 RepID=UPI0021B32918|nr:carboxymuconolactone decarboxylase family protein [Mycobacterium sp. SMC-8]UXA13549.1 carboxymuconolactone decarboxylase family protein [Mycobacterium sp. SMC-8]
MTSVETGRLERGRRAFAEVMTFPAPDDASPATTTLLDFVYAEVWQRPALTRRSRRFVTLPCVAAADAEGALRDHVYAALNSGDVSIVEMRETVLHFAVYGGWPKASRFNMVVDEQWERINREHGRSTPPAEPLLPLPTPSDPEARLRVGEQTFKTVNCLPYAPGRDNPFSGAGILNFVFGEMWLRPGLGMRERRLVTVACVAFQDAPYPILSHVYAALKSRDLSFDEMDELALHFAAYYGWPKASHLNQVIAEQKQRVTEEWADEAS